MKYLMHMLMQWFDRESGADADDRYLAQSSDLSELEIRLQALERRSP